MCNKDKMMLTARERAKRTQPKYFALLLDHANFPLFYTQCIIYYFSHMLIIRYRLAAVDHGQFSFIDIKHNDWPVALITNPKNMLFMMPQKENSKSIITSTHVR